MSRRTTVSRVRNTAASLWMFSPKWDLSIKPQSSRSGERKGPWKKRWEEHTSWQVWRTVKSCLLGMTRPSLSGTDSHRITCARPTQDPASQNSSVRNYGRWWLLGKGELLFSSGSVATGRFPTLLWMVPHPSTYWQHSLGSEGCIKGQKKVHKRSIGEVWEEMGKGSKDE